MDWKTMLRYIAGSVDEELLLRNEYLVAENRVVPSIYSSASPMGRKSALRREIPRILRGFQGRLSC